MTQKTPEPEFVPVRFKATGAVGTVPAGALEFWKTLGYEAISEDVHAAAVVAADPSVFDPSAQGVSAKNVADYLSGLDTATPEGQAEYDRVVGAEEAGANRSTAIPS